MIIDLDLGQVLGGLALTGLLLVGIDNYRLRRKRLLIAQWRKRVNGE